jgi:hypothetical protein
MSNRYHYYLVPDDHGDDYGPVDNYVRTIDHPCTDFDCPRRHVHVVPEHDHRILDHRGLDNAGCPEHGQHCSYVTDGHHH